MKAHLRRDKTSPYLSEATSQGLCQMAHIEEMESPPPRLLHSHSSDCSTIGQGIFSSTGLESSVLDSVTLEP